MSASSGNALPGSPGDCRKRMSSTEMSEGKQRKKGGGVVGRSIQEELCTICGDRASGYHYNALSCEGCKGFFRRSVTKGSTYVCKTGGKCEMDMWMRRKCPFCRLRRCEEAGMSKDCLLTREQITARDSRRKSRSNSGAAVSAGPDLPEDAEPNGMQSKPELASNCQADRTEDFLTNLPDNVKTLIQRVVICQDQYEMPSEETIRPITALLKTFNPEDPKEAKTMLYTQLAHFTVFATQLIVEFAKKIPGFEELCIEDEIALLKGSTGENLMLRTARMYNPVDKTITMADGKAYTRNTMNFVGFEGLTPVMFSFCDSLAVLEVDNAEFGLLTCISLFSDRGGLKEPAKVDQTQEIYTKALQLYCRSKTLGSELRFAKLMMKITDLRTLNKIHSEVCISLKIKMGTLPSILMDCFDLT